MNIYLVKWQYKVERVGLRYGDLYEMTTDTFKGEFIVTCRDEYYAAKAADAMHPKQKVESEVIYLGPA